MTTLSKMVLLTMTLSVATLAGCKQTGNPAHVCEHLDEIAKKDGAEPIIKKCKFKLGMKKGAPNGGYDTLSKCLMAASDNDAAKACLK